MIDGEPNRSKHPFKLFTTAPLVYRSNELRIKLIIKMCNAPLAVRGPAH
jgi:hypothetical protein